MNWDNLGKYEAIRQSQLESEYKCPVTTPLIHFHSHCVVMLSFHLPTFAFFAGLIIIRLAGTLRKTFSTVTYIFVTLT